MHLINIKKSKFNATSGSPLRLIGIANIKHNIGFVHYNTAEEVDRLVGALYDLAKQR